LTQGWKKPGFLYIKKNPAQLVLFGFFGFFGIFGFVGFFCFFSIFAQKREFLGFFSVSKTLLGASINFNHSC
jgi:hypothetical protein